MRTRRIFAVVIAMAAVMLGLAPTATAITNGDLDGNGHPMVVLILMEVDGAPAYRCSGTLISPTYVLTAGHCTGEPGEFSGMRIFTESDVDNGNNNYPYGGGKNSIEAKRWASHPEFTEAAFYLHDVGMIELRKPVRLGQYGTLPGLDSLDALKVKNTTTFTSVGYGLQQVNSAFSTGNRIRMVAHPKLDQINTGFTGPGSILLSNNASTGGTCFGDSGGPNFLGNSLTVAGVTSFGLNGSCGGTGGVFRMDRSDVLDFVADFVR
jgi:V8-like Glu-specific endopeptidase